MIKAVIFDFDGVITESNDIKTEAFAKLFKGEGKRIVKKVVDYHLNNAGVSRYKKFKYIYKEILKRPLKNGKFEMLCARFSELVVEDVVSCPYVKGAKEFLEKHASSYKCYVLSATPLEEIKKIITRRKIGHYFSEIYGSPDKKSEVVKKILKGEKLDPKNLLYIGDAMSDYRAAKDSGIHFIARVAGRNSVFSDVKCQKISNLLSLGQMLKQVKNEVKYGA